MVTAVEAPGVVATAEVVMVVMVVMVVAVTVETMGFAVTRVVVDMVTEAMGTVEVEVGTTALVGSMVVSRAATAATAARPPRA